jgi:chemotaxis protein MotB
VRLPARELVEVRSQMQGIAVLRLDVLKKVKQSIDAQLSAHAPSGATSARIAENGNIVIDESLVFEFNSHTIKQDGKRFLDTLANAFANVLGDPTVRQNIDVVLVQGHTDERGSIVYNRELSAKRADAVLQARNAFDARLSPNCAATVRRMPWSALASANGCCYVTAQPASGTRHRTY